MNGIDLFNRIDNNNNNNQVVKGNVGTGKGTVVNKKIQNDIMEFLGRGKYNIEQQAIFNKGNKKGFFLGRYLVDNKSTQSRIQSVAEDLKIKNYRKKKRPDLIVEIKNKLKDNSKKKKIK